MAVNVGRDADTYGAIYGQLAGAYYGENGIPLEWRSVIAKRDTFAFIMSVFTAIQLPMVAFCIMVFGTYPNFVGVVANEIRLRRMDRESGTIRS